VGLEDGLFVSDLLAPGGIRKGRTAEQVRNLRKELQTLGCRVLSAEETRCVLQMPTTTETLLLAAMNATSQVTSSDLSPMISMSNALSSLRLEFDSREQWLLERLGKEQWEDPTKSAFRVRELLQKAGLHVRYFIEERDRYPASRAENFRNIYDIQSLNYVYELVQDKGHDRSPFERALQNLAEPHGICSDAFLTSLNQRKSSNLRFLKYLSFLSSSFSPDRFEVLNLGLRVRPGYCITTFMLNCSRLSSGNIDE
jgi:hypothetical protein